MELNKDDYIISLDLITACGCNLDCDYCEIAKNRKSHLKENDELQKNTIKALQDGTFLLNVKKTLESLNNSGETVQHIDFWGQEPTMTLPYFTQNMKDWLDYFPNVKTFFFSTNGIDYGNNIFDFIQTLDANINRDILFSLQISYDGLYGMENIRGGKKEAIVNNISNLLKKINEIELKHVKMIFRVHGVISFDLIKYLDTSEKIFNYFKDIDEFINMLLEINKNPKLEIDRMINLALQNPYDASSSDGINLSSFISKCLTIDMSSFKMPTNPAYPFLTTFISQKYEDIPRFKEEYSDLLPGEEYLNESNWRLTHPKDDSLNPFIYCGVNNRMLKIMYDGTLLPCQNLVYNNYEEEYCIDDTTQDYIKKTLAKHHYNINPQQDSEEHVNKILSLFKIGLTSSFVWQYHYTVNLMLLLSKNHQIHSSYINNQHKILWHAYLVTLYGSCGYNNMITTGSYYMRTTGLIKTLCNGLLDQVIDWTSQVKHAKYHRCLRNDEICEKGNAKQ